MPEILSAVQLPGAFVGVQGPVDGPVADGMHADLVTVFVRPGNDPIELLFFVLGQAGITRFLGEVLEHQS